MSTKLHEPVAAAAASSLLADDKCKAVITFASKETEEVAQNVLRLDDSAFRGVHKVVDSSADESPSWGCWSFVIWFLQRILDCRAVRDSEQCRHLWGAFCFFSLLLLPVHAGLCAVASGI